jgi:hypothetical protein
MWPKSLRITPTARCVARAQELEEAHTLREAAAAQLALLTENPKLYEPAVEQQRQMAAQMMMQAQMQQR